MLRSQGHGCVLLVHGEAGIGKSSLVSALRERPPAGSRVLVGACDALSTPRTLGPLRDLTPFVGSRLGDALRAGDREEVFAALHDELASTPGTVLVVEDVHWSDEASLDALRFVARRIDTLNAVLVLTYRDDELERGIRSPGCSATSGRTCATSRFGDCRRPQSVSSRRNVDSTPTACSP